MSDTAPAAQKKRGLNTLEGKARSRMNALKHGLRAREFGLLPEENQAEWALHVRDLRAGYGPVDATEEKLITAIAVAMWKGIRADRVEADVMSEIAPSGPGRSHGTDMSVSEHRLSLGTAIRYAFAAGMATQRAQRAFLAHRKAKRAGLILPAAGREKCTNEFRHPPTLALALYRAANDAAPAQPERTNEFPLGDFPLTRPARTGAIPTAPPKPRPPGEGQSGPPARPFSDDPPRRFEHALMHTSAMPQIANIQACYG